MEIKNYNINQDLTVDVNGSVHISNRNLTNIPVQFGIVEDTFDCNNNELTSLQGSPKEVHYSFYCNRNKITSLIGSPEKVKGLFIVIMN